MGSIKKIFTDFIIFLAIVFTIIYIYQVYGERVLVYMFGEQREAIVIDGTTLFVTYADDPDERHQGLSGVKALGTLEGKLFFFAEEGDHGFWMKDMNFPIDILWINNDLEIVHIEENVTPDSYPAVYYPSAPARFVLETNAFFADTYKIEVGEKLSLPAADLPKDLKDRLQNF